MVPPRFPFPSLSWTVLVSCCKSCDAGSIQTRWLKAVSLPRRKTAATEAQIYPKEVLVWKATLKVTESLRKCSLRSWHIPQQREQWSPSKCSSWELFWRPRRKRMKMVYLWHLGKYHRQCSKDLSFPAATTASAKIGMFISGRHRC